MRTADYERWLQLDFVVGIKVELSNNHTCRGVKGEFVDICDELAGEYPKDFKFVGWHPHCRCHAVPILKTPEEMMADKERIMRGEEPSEESENEVKEMPQGFNDWMKDNEERARTAYSIPYFVKDNKKYISKELSSAYGEKKAYDSFLEYEIAVKNNKRQSLSKEQRKNIIEINKVSPVQQGKMMDFGEADSNNPNPNYLTKGYIENGYSTNCQTCTYVYEARRRGFNIEAMPSKRLPNGKLEVESFYKNNKMTQQGRFLNIDGSEAKWNFLDVKNTTIGELSNSLYTEVSDKGRYEMYYSYLTNVGTNNNPRYISNAHVIIIEHQDNGNILWYDPQSGARGLDINKYLSDRYLKIQSLGVVRIDNKLLNPKFMQLCLKHK